MIIDKDASSRSLVKTMFAGTEHRVDTSASAEETLEKTQKENYDVYICDLNLGDGLDGLQLLDELKLRKSYEYPKIFILVLSKRAEENILQTAESEPDGFLLKPFKKLELDQVFENIQKKNKELESIYLAIQDQDYKKAIELCTQKLQNKTPFAVNILKLKMKMLLHTQDLAQAISLCKPLHERHIVWAAMGLGKAHYLEALYQEAAQIFKNIIHEQGDSVDPYDWVAKCNLEMGKYDEAQMYIENALEINSKAITRYQILTEIAEKNNKLDVAEKSLRGAVKLSKFSSKRRPGDFTKLADLLMKKSESEPDSVTAKRSAEEILELIKNLEALYPDTKEIQAIALIYKAKALLILQEYEKARGCVHEASELIEKYKLNISAEMLLEQAVNHLSFQEKAQAEAFLKQAVNQNAAPDLLKKADDIAEKNNLVINEKTLNREGIRLYQTGKLIQSAPLFEFAAHETPDSVSINLNAAQVLVQCMQKYNANPIDLDKVHHYLKKTKELHPEDPKHLERYQRLVDLYRDLKKKENI
ncbi:MAG: response regulator [Gammaproteobacteria bacterium]